MKIFQGLLVAVAFAEEIADDVVYSDGSPVNQEEPLVPRSGGRPDATDSTAVDRLAVDRRYADLTAMSLKLWSKNGFRGKDKFDERKYWTYGCHCLFLGDRPMSETGGGSPVDRLDQRCRSYKNCLRCVRNKQGGGCLPELRKYSWLWNSRTETLESTNAAGTCPRELFECDRQFVQDTFDNKDVFDEQYHAFWSTTGFDYRDQGDCPVGSNLPTQHECCGGGDRQYWWYSATQNQCCDDKKIVSITETC